MADDIKGTPNLRDYQHAAKTFRDGDYRLAPKQKFLFYVVFNFSTTANKGLSDDIRRESSMLVKAVDLPTYTFDTSPMNQYNRWRTVQTKINYNPIQIRFHDDKSDISKRLWYAYLDYHYEDQKNGNTTVYNNRDTYTEHFGGKVNNRWGMAFPKDEAFFTDIKLYSIYGRRQFSEYTLINPIITQYQHDTHDHSQSEFLENSMQLQYETVKYATGTMTVDDEYRENIGGTNVIEGGPKGFGDLHYDGRPSTDITGSAVAEDTRSFKDLHPDEKSKWALDNVSYDNNGALLQNENELKEKEYSEALAITNAKAIAKAKYSNKDYGFPSGKDIHKNSIIKTKVSGLHLDTVSIQNEDGSVKTVSELVSQPLSSE